MPVSLLLTFVSTLAFGIQFLIFVYLYPSHRVRFFNYLVWAWGFFVLSKGLKLLETILAAAVDLGGLMSAAFVGAQFFIVAAALAYRYDYAIRRRGAILGGLCGPRSASGSVICRRPLPSCARRSGSLLGAAQVGAGLAFWSRSADGVRYRGARLLAVSFWLWAIHKAVSLQLLNAEPGTTTHLVVHATFVCLYFSSTFAIIIMVLDRARSEMRSLKELNERLVDGLGEGLELVDGDFAIRHANRWMLEQFGPVAGRRCYEVLTAGAAPLRGLSSRAPRHRSRSPCGSRSTVWVAAASC